MNIYVARQPIFDRDGKVVAYELLYRDSEQNFFNASVESNVATAILLMNSYLHFGIDYLVDGKTAFINFGDHLIKNEIPQLLPKNNVVIEILENIHPEPAVIDSLKELRRRGYTLALDDFVEGEAFEEIMQLCQIIKIDMLNNSKDTIKHILRKYANQGKIFLAEKVETQKEYEWCRTQGFDYYQGYFFARPSMLQSKEMAMSSSQYARLLEALYEKEPDYRKIAGIIEMDTILTYKLLRLVNSSFAIATKIRSVQHALSILGINAFTKWLTLAMVQNLGRASHAEVVKVAMIRSKMLELMAKRADVFKSHQDEMSLLGILSVLDVLLQKPMEEVVKLLPISDEMKRTFLREESAFLYPYELCLAYERGDFRGIDRMSDEENVYFSELSADYVEAVKWAEAVFHFLEDDDKATQ